MKDLVEVVRCENCISGYVGENGYLNCSDQDDRCVKSDSYCNEGIRKQAED